MASEQRVMTPEETFIFFICIVSLLVFILVFLIVQWCRRTVVNVLWPLDTQFYSRKWDRLRKLSDVEDSRPLAIIYANSLLDHALKKCKYSGETMSQRLVSAECVFKNKNQVWDAHQLRNKIVHDINMELLTEKEMKQALQTFRQALVDLGAL